MKRFLTFYLILQILLTAGFFLWLGLGLASSGTERVWHGEPESLVYADDLPALFGALFGD